MEKSPRGGSLDQEQRRTKGEVCPQPGELPQFGDITLHWRPCVKTGLFPQLPKLVSKNRPVPACGEEHTNYVELRYESECYEKYQKKWHLVSHWQYFRSLLFLSDESYNSAVTHIIKQFTTGSIYIYMATSKCLIIDAGEKSHLLVLDVVSGLQNW